MGDHSLKMGWAEVDITPQRSVHIAGNFGLRISEGVADPISVTAWAIESEEEQAIFVCCDLVCISDELRDSVRSKLSEQKTGIDPMKVVIHATHTHTAPAIRASTDATPGYLLGVNLQEISVPMMAVEQYIAFVSEQIVIAVKQAWGSRSLGGIAFGMDYAVLGRNRIWVDAQGQSAKINGLTAAKAEHFRHIEGYEDHSLNVMVTYDAEQKVTGLVINFACTAQVPSEKSPHQISANMWCEVRGELRRRFGSRLFILPQCSAAGEQTGHTPFDKAAEKRMLRLKGRTKLQEVAKSIADTIEGMLPAISQEINLAPAMRHQVDTVDLTANRLTAEEVRFAEGQADEWQMKFEQEKEKVEKHPELRQKPSWYDPMSNAFARMEWYRNVANRFELQKEKPTRSAEVHIVRLGDVIFASVPFEYYLDYGIQIKVRSPATQTFLVQLAGSGSYVPSPRALLGGGYGATAASNVIGAEGGQELAEHIVQTIRKVWD